MANFRMFSKSVTENDKFYTMSSGAQALYLHLCMNADDDGIVDSPVGIRRAAGLTEKNFQELVDRGFILLREELAVIVHWHAQNSIKPDRYKETDYPSAKDGLSVTETGVYVLSDAENPHSKAPGTEWKQSGDEVETERFQSGDEEDTERKQSGDRVETIEEEEEIDIYSSPPPIIPPTPSAEGTEKETAILTDGERERLTAVMGADYLDYYLAKMQTFINAKGREYKNPSATIEKWYREDMKSSARPPGEKRRRRDTDTGSFDTDEFFNAALRNSYQLSGGALSTPR